MAQLPSKNAHITLIIGGGIAAYKSCELIRLIRKNGMTVRCVLTDAGAQFVTPMTLAALSENPVHRTLWDLKDEVEMGHIQLSREADLVVVCPATADLIAKMAHGIADNLATTLLLATDTPVMVVPAMNVRMWEHEATQRNIAILRKDGLMVMQPDEGAMACGEFGAGRLPEPVDIFAQIQSFFANKNVSTSAHKPLQGRKILITAGPTHEPIDPVRYIANRSSGKQGFALADAAAKLGADVTLISGPVALNTPANVTRINVETARQMKTAVQENLPCDVAIMVAAIADWRVEQEAAQKMKKQNGALPALKLTENPDILAGLAKNTHRPPLLIGFAAETQNVIGHAKAKLERKGCDWIIANDVSGDVMGGADNAVHIVTQNGVDSWDNMTKEMVAQKLMEKIAHALT